MKSTVFQGLPLPSEMGEIYREYTWLVAPYLKASFPVIKNGPKSK